MLQMCQGASFVVAVQPHTCPLPMSLKIWLIWLGLGCNPIPQQCAVQSHNHGCAPPKGWRASLLQANGAATTQMMQGVGAHDWGPHRLPHLALIIANSIHPPESTNEELPLKTTLGNATLVLDHYLPHENCLNYACQLLANASSFSQHPPHV